MVRQMAVSKNDLETMLGDPKKAILAMILPLTVSYLITQVNLYVDTFWTSGLGASVSSAISTIAPIYNIVSGVGVALGVGASATIAFRLGQGDFKTSNNLAGNTIILALIFSLISSLLVYFLSGPIVIAIGAEDIYDECMEYVLPYVLMSWALILNGTIAGLLRSEGAAKKSMTVLIVSAVFNMVLDPLLIYILDWGVFGAGMTTSLSSFIATALGIVWYVSGKMHIKLDREAFRPSKDSMKEVLVVGAPKTAETAITQSINMAQRIFFIVAAGTVGVMLYNIPWRYVALAAVPISALGAFLIPICSAALGQRKPEKMEAAIGYSAKFTLTVSVVIAVFIFVFADILMDVFTYSESMAEQKEMLVWVTRMYCILIPPYAFTLLGNSILQALKKSMVCTVLVLCWGVLKLICYAVASQYSFEAIIISFVVLQYINGIVMMSLALHHTKKKKAAILSGAEAA
ncbi:MAG: hypothetical protein J6U12_00455 [Candidatus Methanomethylophilaceae archaeon]|nr:hypothetical protein [Candidatus Methanomethylophilaceae archaeon]